MHLLSAKITLLALALLWCCFHAALAQKPTTSYITAQEFPILDPDKKVLPYDLEIDSLGYLYSAGPGGVYRFNGKKMTKLNRISGIYKSLHKDAFERLWVVSPWHGYFMIGQDSLIPYQFNDSLKSYRRFPTTVFMDKQDTLHLGRFGSGYLKVTPEGKIIDCVGRSTGMHGYVISRLKNGTPFYYAINQKMPTDEFFERALYYQHSDGSFSQVTTFSDKGSSNESSLVLYEDDTWVFNSGNAEMLQGHKDSLIQRKQFPERIISTFRDSKENLWLGTFNGGIYKTDKDLNILEHLCKDAACGITTEDEHGGLWMKSNQDRFSYFPNTGMFRYSKEFGQLPNNYVGKFVTDHERLIFPVYEFGIKIIDGDSILDIPLPDSDFPTMKRGTRPDAPTTTYYDRINHKYWLGNLRWIGSWDGKEWQIDTLDIEGIKSHKLIQLEAIGKDHLIGATTAELIHIENGKPTRLIPFKVTPKLLFSCFSIDPTGKMWIGTNKGIKTYSGQDFESPEISGDLQFENQRIKQIHCALDRVWVLTFDKGLFMIHNGISTQITDSKGKIANLNEVFVSREGEIWGRSFQTNGLLFRIRIQEGKPVVNTYLFDDLAFQYSFNANQLVVIDRKIFVGNYGGIFMTTIDDLIEQPATPKVIIRDVFANYEPLEKASFHELPYDRNSINLEFEPVTFRMAETEFRSRLVGFDSTWITPKHNGLQYTNLAPGSYLFQIQARLPNEEWGPIEEIQFLILTPYWQTWWFRILAVLAGALLLGGSIYLWFRAQRKRAALQIDKLKAEQQALRAQMNPHFVYNALNSAQKFLLLGNTEDYNVFISRLSKLMRSGLEYSRLAFIPVKHELEFLNNYLKIETQRFPNRFTYRIDVDDELQEYLEDVAIPPLMIQPICENAIKHAYVDEPVEILVQLKYWNEDAVKVKVQDNGVGYKSHPPKNGHLKNRKSLGLNILSSRIDLLQKQHFKTSYKIQPLYPKSGKGTLVELILPVQ